jgi:hypothetical protein
MYKGEVPFYKGKDKFFLHRKGWKVSKQGPTGGAMISRLEAIVRSGIYGFLDDLSRFHDFFQFQRANSRVQSSFKRYSFRHLSVTAYVYIVGLGVSIVCIVIELIYAYKYL